MVGQSCDVAVFALMVAVLTADVAALMPAGVISFANMLLVELRTAD